MGIYQWVREPVCHSFRYTYEGGFATGGGASYGPLFYGGGWQEKGPNYGFYGYVGLGYSYGEKSIISIGAFYTYNYTQNTGSVAVTLGYTHKSGASIGLTYDITNNNWTGSIGYSEPAVLREHRKYWKSIMYESYQSYEIVLLADYDIANPFTTIKWGEVGNAFREAGKIVAGTKIAVGAKAAIFYYGIPAAADLAVSGWVRAGTPQGQKFLMGSVDFLESALPGVPVMNKAGATGVVSSKIYDKLKDN